LGDVRQGDGVLLLFNWRGLLFEGRCLFFFGAFRIPQLPMIATCHDLTMFSIESFLTRFRRRLQLFKMPFVVRTCFHFFLLFACLSTGLQGFIAPAFEDFFFFLLQVFL
jgi:hypothetical protein